MVQDPKITIKDLLKDNWDNTNTSISYDPDIHTGWRTEDPNNPEVTVSSADEAVLDGGNTGYSAADGSGGGGVQEVRGTVFVECFSDRDVESTNPKKLTYEFAEEVRRLVRSNQHSLTDMRIAAPGPRDENPPDADEHPPKFHYTQRINYVREDRPP